MSSARTRDRMLPLNTDSKSAKFVYVLKKHDIKIATVIFASVSLIFSIFLWFISPSHFLHLFPIRFIPVTVIALFLGIYKKRPWMFLPFFWFLGSLIFLNILSYGLGINAAYDYIKEYHYHEGRIFDSFYWSIFVNIISIYFGICFYLITHRCYKIYVEKAKFEYDGNDDDGPPEAEGPPKWCFGYSAKNGTLIICGIFFICCIMVEILVLIKDNFEINFNSIFPLFCVILTLIFTIAGIWKEKSWLFVPFLWILETFVFISFTLLINAVFSTIKNEKFRYNYEKFMLMNNIYPFKYWIKMMFFESVLQTYVQNIFVLKGVCFIICIFAVAATTWMFLIVHSYYMILNQKYRDQKLERKLISIEEC